MSLSQPLLASLLGQVGQQLQAQAAQNAQHQLQTALAAQRAHIQIASFQQQAQLADKAERMDPDVVDLVEHFNVPDPLARRLNDIMKTRVDSFEQDMLTLWEVLREASDP